MSTRKSSIARQNRLGSFENTEHFCFVLGQSIGTLITAAFSAPPTSPEAAQETEKAFGEVGLSAEMDGAAPEVLLFYKGALAAIRAHVDSGVIAASERPIDR